MLLPSLTMLAQADITSACGSDPALVCAWLYDLTDSAVATRLLEPVVIVPAILLGAFLLHRMLRRWIDGFVSRIEVDVRRRVERGRELGTRGGSQYAETRRRQRLHAIGGALRSAAGVIIWLTAIVLVLAQFVNLRPILAGAGLAGLIVGFGAQNMIRDFLAGISMLVEDQFGVGDWIDVDGTVGEVEQVGLRVTRIRDIDGVVWHIPNGVMQKVGNLTQRWARATLDVPFALDTSIPHARGVVERVAKQLAVDPEWGQDIIAPPEIWGVQSWGPEGLSLRLVIATRPLRNWDVVRQLRERLKHAFEQEGIRMPAEMHEIGAQRTGEALRVSEWPRGAPAPGMPPESPGSDGVRRDAAAGPPDTTGRIPTIRPPGPAEG